MQPEQVLLVMAAPAIGHRGPEFSRMVLEGTGVRHRAQVNAVSEKALKACDTASLPQSY